MFQFTYVLTTCQISLKWQITTIRHKIEVAQIKKSANDSLFIDYIKLHWYMSIS